MDPVEIQLEQLSEEAQLGVIDAFIWREGTDYGAHEVAHETKQAQIRRHIENKKVRLVFDPSSESITLMTEREWKEKQGSDSVSK